MYGIPICLDSVPFELPSGGGCVVAASRVLEKGAGRTRLNGRFGDAPGILKLDEVSSIMPWRTCSIVSIP
jgi:hypothetical protein